MTNFGWSLPAGCGLLPGEEPCPPCPICGGDIEADRGDPMACNCPDCSVCGSCGDPACINAHMDWTEWPALRWERPADLEMYRQEREAEDAYVKGEKSAMEKAPDDWWPPDSVMWI